MYHLCHLCPAPPNMAHPTCADDELDLMPLRVRMGMTGQELPRIMLHRCKCTASDAREAIARVLGILPFGLRLTVAGEVWAGGPAPLALGRVTRRQWRLSGCR